MNAITKATSVAVLVTLGLALTAGAAELPPATQVLKESGVSAGLAVVVGTTDGKLEADLTRGGADKAAWVRMQTVAEILRLEKDGKPFMINGKPYTSNFQRIADQEPADAGRMLVHGLALSDEVPDANWKCKEQG